MYAFVLTRVVSAMDDSDPHHKVSADKQAVAWMLWQCTTCVNVNMYALGSTQTLTVADRVVSWSGHESRLLRDPVGHIVNDLGMALNPCDLSLC